MSISQKNTFSIEEVIFYHYRTIVNLNYSHWQKKELQTIAVEVRSNGLSGWGEFDPTPWRHFFKPLTIAHRMARSILNRDALNPSGILRKWMWFSLERDPWSWGWNRALRSTREGFSIALYDLAGKLQRRSTAEILGGIKRRVIPGMPVIHVGSPKEMARVAAIWVYKKGFHFLKVKLTGDYEQDLKRLDAIRSEVGVDVDLQIDYNYGLQDVRSTIRQVTDLDNRYGLTIVEDPIKPFLDGIFTFRPYAIIKNEIRPALMIDGASYWPNVKNIVRAKAADIINQHTAMQGGLDLALLINQTAEKAGIASAIGSSGHIGIQDKAFQLLASVMALGRPCESIGFYKYADEEFSGFYGLNIDPSVLCKDQDYNDGNIHILDIPGLGVVIDEEKFLKLQICPPVIVR